MRSPLQTDAVLFELVDGAYARRDVVDVVHTDDDAKAILEQPDDARFAVDALELEARLLDEDDASWITSMYTGSDPQYDTDWIPHVTQTVLAQLVDEYETLHREQPPISARLEILKRHDTDADVDALERYSAPASPSDCTFEKIDGTGSRTVVNDFLEGGRDGLVFHELGSVSSWKAAFVARHPETGEIVSCVTLHHYHPSTNGVELAITRVANHEAAPANTSSYMIARARKYAERAGYERIATYAGVGGNEGVCYRAAGFEQVGEPVEVGGKDWKGERSGESWLKQKYVYELEPETYAGKSDEWAIDSLTDDRIEPGRSAYRSSSPCMVVAD